MTNVKHISFLSTSNNKGLYFLASNNKNISKIAVKHLSLYYYATTLINKNNLFIFSPLTGEICRCNKKSSNKNKDSTIIAANTTTTKQKGSDCFILFASMDSIYNEANKHATTKNNNDRQNVTPSYFRPFKHQFLKEKRKIITKIDSDDSKRDKMSDAINKET